MRRLRSRTALFAALLLAGAATRAAASPLQFLPVGDPLEAELRLSDLYASPAEARFSLPHLGARPLQLRELAPADASAAAALTGAKRIAAARLARAFARDLELGAGPASTPRLLRRTYPNDERFEFSAGIEGAREFVRAEGTHEQHWRNGSGLHTRIAVQSGDWLAYSHLFFGESRGAREVTDVLLSGSDLVASTEDSYLAYTHGSQWSAQLGRSRWQWGPGEEGALLLSGTSAPLTGLMLRAHLAPIHAEGFVFNATVEPGRGEQLAAHRIEWASHANAVRLGLTETARYRAGGWQGLYLAGVVPYSIVQRLLDSDTHGALDSLRNNVMLGADASVRIADGTRVYGELLLDDLHAHSAAFPNKYGFQLGLSGTGDVRGTRLSWNSEYTWLSRYVYTSYFGRVYSAHDAPTGFPTGPDARRWRTRVTWDPATDWQLGAIATRTLQGEGSLLTPFVPGTPVPDVGTLEGVVERTRTLEGTLRFWPASGIDLGLRAGRAWVANAAHVTGAERREWTAALSVQLTR